MWLIALLKLVIKLDSSTLNTKLDDDSDFYSPGLQRVQNSRTSSSGCDQLALMMTGGITAYA
jgi:hypothetical protein